MTCIVAIATDGEVVLAGDSAGCSDDGLVELRSDPKVFEHGDYLIGYTTSFRMGQILRYGTELPPPAVPDSVLHGFMIAQFVPVVRQAFREHGFTKTLERGESERSTHWRESGQSVGGKFVVGVRGRLFLVEADFQVAIPRLPYVAIGSGAKVAYGALFASESLPGEERVHVALEAAAMHCSCVRPPFTLVGT